MKSFSCVKIVSEMLISRRHHSDFLLPLRTQSHARSIRARDASVLEGAFHLALATLTAINLSLFDKHQWNDSKSVAGVKWNAARVGRLGSPYPAAFPRKITIIRATRETRAGRLLRGRRLQCSGAFRYSL